MIEPVVSIQGFSFDINLGPAGPEPRTVNVYESSTYYNLSDLSKPMWQDSCIYIMRSNIIGTI